MVLLAKRSSRRRPMVNGQYIERREFVGVLRVALLFSCLKISATEKPVMYETARPPRKICERISATDDKRSKSQKLAYWRN